MIGRGFAPARRSWIHGVEVALRTATVLAAVLVFLSTIGRTDLAAYGMFGGFCAVYGFNEPYRIRARTMGIAAASILSAVATGTLLSAAGAPFAVLAPVVLVFLALGVIVNVWGGLIPTQPFFIMIALLVCAAIPVPDGDLGLRVGVSAGAAAFAWLLGLSGWAIRRAWPGHAEAASPMVRPFFKGLTRLPALDGGVLRDWRVWWTVGENLVAACAAYAAAVMIGGDRPYWAVLTVVSVLAPARARPSAGHAIERVVGTAIGLGVVWLLVPLELPIPVVILMMVVCQFGTQLFVVNAYAVALVFITVMVFGSLSFVLPLDGPILVERLIETVIGSAVGLLVMVPGWVLRRG